MRTLAEITEATATMRRLMGLLLSVGNPYEAAAAYQILIALCWLSEADYQSLVLDDWHWKANFNVSNRHYSQTLAAMNSDDMA